MAYDFREVESKWRDRFDGLAAYKGVDFEKTKEKAYVLTEFPYPSGSGLHVGHAFTMTGADVFARFSRMKGKNVLFPMGWDAFGLPTENYALKTGRKPQEVTEENTMKYKEQMKNLGFSFDWDREVNTTKSDYYKWTQWIFTKLFEKGLAYKKEAPINWCPKDKTGLANEEVIDGKCERCGIQTEKRTMSQWIVKITDYADRLIEGLAKTNFIDKVKAAQINWIDRKEGAKVKFKIIRNEIATSSDPRQVEVEIPRNDDYVEVFTTRIDTIAGATFLAIAPEHPLVSSLSEFDVAQYVEKSRLKSEIERTDVGKEKTGVFSGLMVVNPANEKQIPVWIADYVLASYGTGAVMAVPSHDERDAEMAKKYNLPIDWEMKPDMGMLDLAIQNGWGEKQVTYHLRDWIFSRQHYWGEPIPMVYCETDGWVSVPEEQLPIVLPEIEKYQPTETGESPLSAIPEWVKTVCPKCGGLAKRETDTMPNWAGSDWYFLRYCDPKNEKSLAEMEKMKYWLPVDTYIGGDEHNTLHLLYSRFIYQFLWDLGVVPKEYPEPYVKRLSHGVILGPDGNRMSKSKGNVIVPEDVTRIYGADVVRMYLMFMGPFDATMAWNERSLLGVKRFLDRLHGFVISGAEIPACRQAGLQTTLTETRNDEKLVDANKVSKIVNKLVKEVGDELGNYKYNTSIAKMMEALNDLNTEKAKVGKEDLKKLVLVLAPFAPFLAEELWNVLGGEFSVHAQSWPMYDETLLVENTITISVQINGKMRGTVEITPEMDESRVKEEVLKQEKLAKYLESAEILKIIYIKGKTISFVLKS